MTTMLLSRRAAILGAACALAAPKLSFAATAAPKRIVAIGGPITEIMFGLGCGERIVAVDQTSRFPRAARRKADAGFHDDLSAETLLALAPDLVVTGENAGPAHVLEALRRASVNVVALKDVRRPADVAERIRAAGAATGETARAAALADAVSEDLDAVAQDVGKVGKRRRALILMGLGSGHPPIVSGSGTPAALALEMTGTDNAAGHFTGWRALKPDRIMELEPDAIVALSIGAPLLAADVSSHPALKGSPATRENRVAVADALAFTGFGPRVAHVIGSAARAIYPEANVRALPPRSWVEYDLVSL